MPSIDSAGSLSTGKPDAPRVHFLFGENLTKWPTVKAIKDVNASVVLDFVERDILPFLMRQRS